MIKAVPTGPGKQWALLTCYLSGGVMLSLPTVLLEASGGLVTTQGMLEACFIR